ncbi:MAG: response regulator [Candidatus Zixiibacteriota bacterium]
MQIQEVNILIADDDPDDRLMIRDAFEENHLGTSLFFVENGEELLYFLYNKGKYSSAKDYPRPGLILMDLNMPIIDGREALREIKSNDQLRSIPVIVLSTSEADEDICRTYSLGVNSFITKPVSFSSLVDTIRTFAQYWLNIVALPHS